MPPASDHGAEQAVSHGRWRSVRARDRTSWAAEGREPSQYRPESSKAAQLVLSQALSRRRFLSAAGLAAASAPLTLGGCQGSTPPGRGGASKTTTSVTSPAPSGDPALVALAAGIEVLAVSAYQRGLSLAAANRLGSVPAALTTFATMAVGHHQAALARWNQVLTAAGKTGVSQPPSGLQATVDRMFTRVTSADAVARIGLLVEQTAADTYLSMIPMLRSPDAVTVAAQLQVLDQEHAATLHFLLGSYPVPDAVQNTNLALRASTP